MATDAILDFYDALDFEIIDFDGYDTLFVELLDDGTYATVSDDDGHMPDTKTDALSTKCELEIL